MYKYYFYNFDNAPVEVYSGTNNFFSDSVSGKKNFCNISSYYVHNT